MRGRTREGVVARQGLPVGAVQYSSPKSAAMTGIFLDEMALIAGNVKVAGLKVAGG